MKRRNAFDMKLSSRAAAIRIVAEWMQTGAFPGQLLEAVTDDRAFVMELVYGVVRWRDTWSGGAEICAVSTGADIRGFICRAPIRFCISTDVAEYAAVNETVAAVRQTESTAVTGFVNAILRRALPNVRC